MNKSIKLLAAPTLLTLGMGMVGCASTNHGSNVDFQAIESATAKCGSKIIGKQGMVINGKKYYQYRNAIEAAEQANDKRAIKVLDDALENCMNNAGFK